MATTPPPACYWSRWVWPCRFTSPACSLLPLAGSKQYLKDNTNPAALIRATMNYASLSGLTGDMLEAVSGIAGGWGDEATKELVGARQGASGVGRVIPAAGSIDQAIRVASGKADLHTALKQLPFSSVWFLQPLLNLTKEQ